MANVLTVKSVNGVRSAEREKCIRYTVALSGNYAQHVRGQNVGEVLNLGAALNPGFQPGALFGLEGPDTVYIVNIGGTGYSMSIVPGADPQHWLLCIYSNVATELAAGAYPAGLTTDLDIVIEASGRSAA